jgi:hypothetical protein
MIPSLSLEELADQAAVDGREASSQPGLAREMSEAAT